MVEPDTASVTKQWDGKLKVSHTSIGAKTHKIVLTAKGVKKLENTDKKLLCLSYEQILKVAEVGVLLEKGFGGPRNIEWAFFKVSVLSGSRSCCSSKKQKLLFFQEARASVLPRRSFYSSKKQELLFS